MSIFREKPTVVTMTEEQLLSILRQVSVPIDGYQYTFEYQESALPYAEMVFNIRSAFYYRIMEPGVPAFKRRNRIALAFDTEELAVEFKLRFADSLADEE